MITVLFEIRIGLMIPVLIFWNIFRKLGIISQFMEAIKKEKRKHGDNKHS